LAEGLALTRLTRLTLRWLSGHTKDIPSLVIEWLVCSEQFSRGRPRFALKAKWFGKGDAKLTAACACRLRNHPYGTVSLLIDQSRIRPRDQLRKHYYSYFGCKQTRSETVAKA
jgi:hypothetical protein